MTQEVTVGQEVSAADGALNRGATIVAESKVALTGELSALEGKLASIGSQWQGAGSQAFQTVFARVKENSTKIINSLDKLEDDLNQSQTTYTASDDQAAQQLNQLQGRLG